MRRTGRVCLGVWSLSVVLFTAGCTVLKIDIPGEHGMTQFREIRPWGKRHTVVDYDPITRKFHLTMDTSNMQINEAALGSAIGEALKPPRPPK